MYSSMVWLCPSGGGNGGLLGSGRGVVEGIGRRVSPGLGEAWKRLQVWSEQEMVSGGM